MTPEHREEARALKRLWDSATDRPSQAVFGERFEIGNQSAVGQFLRGLVPLSQKAAVGFAKGLGCDIAAFSPRLAAQVSELSSLSASGATPIPSSATLAKNTQAPVTLQPQELARALDLLAAAVRLLDERTRTPLEPLIALWAEKGDESGHLAKSIASLLSQARKPDSLHDETKEPDLMVRKTNIYSGASDGSSVGAESEQERKREDGAGNR